MLYLLLALSVLDLTPPIPLSCNEQLVRKYLQLYDCERELKQIKEKTCTEELKEVEIRVIKCQRKRPRAPMYRQAYPIVRTC